MKEPFNLERYQQWRATLPWTDEQFAVACEEEATLVEATSPWLARSYRSAAERARSGHINGKTLRVAMPRLIKTCPCGRKALYRTGNEGRCSTHKMIKSAAEINRVMRVEEKSTAFQQARKHFDDVDLRHAQARSKALGRKHRSRYNRKG